MNPRVDGKEGDDSFDRSEGRHGVKGEHAPHAELLPRLSDDGLAKEEKDYLLCRQYIKEVMWTGKQHTKKIRSD